MVRVLLAELRSRVAMADMAESSEGHSPGQGSVALPQGAGNVIHKS
jgi:hypothetical protein